MKKRCLIHFSRCESPAVGWVLHTSVEDARVSVKGLTDAEIEYCLVREGRTTVRKMLEAEKRKRAKTGAKDNR